MIVPPHSFSAHSEAELLQSPCIIRSHPEVQRTAPDCTERRLPPSSTFVQLNVPPGFQRNVYREEAASFHNKLDVDPTHLLRLRLLRHFVEWNSHAMYDAEETCPLPSSLDFEILQENHRTAAKQKPASKTSWHLQRVRHVSHPQSTQDLLGVKGINPLVQKLQTSN